MKENSKTITDWANNTFGNATLTKVFERAKAEWVELEEKQGSLTDFGYPTAKECADITVCLARLCHMHGYDLFDLVDKVMHQNRYEREWISNGDGTGRHVKK